MFYTPNQEQTDSLRFEEGRSDDSQSQEKQEEETLQNDKRQDRSIPDSQEITVTRFRIKQVDIPKVQWTNPKLMQGHREYLLQTTFSVTSSAAKDQPNPYEVWRRFRDFQALFSELQHDYPGCLVPPLPEKSLRNSLEGDDSLFVEERRQALKRFLEALARHRVLGQSETVGEFLCNERFYHSRQGSGAGNTASEKVVGATKAVSKQLKSLWNQSKNWTPIKALLPQATGCPIGVNQNCSPQMQMQKEEERVTLPIIDPALEDDFQREVVIGSKILSDRLINLIAAVQSQVTTFSKYSDSLLKLRHLLFEESISPSQSRESDENQVCSVDQSQQVESRQMPQKQQEVPLDEALRAFNHQANDLKYTYSKGLLADLEFYHRYTLSLISSISARQARLATLEYHVSNPPTLSSPSQQPNWPFPSPRVEADKLRDATRGLICEYQQLSMEIQIRIIDNVALLAVKYAQVE